MVNCPWQENRFLDLLPQVEEYRIEGNELKLLRFEDANGTRKEIVLLIFEIKD